MKLNDRFLIHKTGEQTILVPSGGAEFSGVVQGNRTLGAILEQLKENTTEEKITEALGARFDAPKDVIEKDVRKVLQELRKIGALDE
ncbi:MAG: PqqD family protein [Oscillospiraceae bacterium]|nr:PqqD family protein [Oscillospiraceae bacterium]